MKYLTHLADDLRNFFDLEEEAENALLAKVKTITDEADKTKLIEEIRNDFPQKTFTGLSIIYEVFAKNPDRWGDFFVEEFQRAFATAEQAENPFDVLDCLEELCFIKNKNTDFGHRIIEIIAPNIGHQLPAIRYQAIDHLGNWMEDGNEEKFRDLIYEIQKKLKDKNWRIRHCAALMLQDLKAVPKNYSQSFIDKLRVKLLNPYQF